MMLQQAVTLGIQVGGSKSSAAAVSVLWHALLLTCIRTPAIADGDAKSAACCCLAAAAARNWMTAREGVMACEALGLDKQELEKVGITCYDMLQCVILCYFVLLKHFCLLCPCVSQIVHGP
jgi:hypothetical protein